MADQHTNGWSKSEMFVMRKLDELQAEQRETTELIRCVDRKVVALKVELRLKSGVWGLLGGLIPAIGALLFILLRG